MATALRVQTVRYGGDGPELLRMLRSVTAAARQVDLATSSSELTVAIGDCGGPSGPDAVLSAQVLAEAREVLEEAGTSLDYVAFKANTGHGAGQNLLARRLADRSKPARDRRGPGSGQPRHVPLAGLPGNARRRARRRHVGIAEARQIPLEHPKAFDPVTGDTPWASGCLIAMRMSVFELARRLRAGLLPTRRRRRPLLAGPPRADYASATSRRRLSFTTSSMSVTGFPAPSAEEELPVVLARLLLGASGGAPRLVDSGCDWAEAHGSELHRRGGG